MQAVILAGGRGERLGPITERVPKPMALVAGVPYLEYQLRFLGTQDITDVVLLTGYLGEQIEQYFGDGRRWNLSIRYSRERVAMGTGGALRDARHLLASEFLVVYGDSFLPIDYSEVLETLEASKSAAVVAVYDNGIEDTTVRNNVALDRDNYVTRYDKRTPGDPELRYVEAGVVALSAPVLDLIPPAKPVSLEEDLFPSLIATRSLVAYVTQQRFYDIGTPERLAVFEHFVRHGQQSK